LLLTTVPLSSFPLIGKLPWKGQNLASHDFLGGATEMPIFLTIDYQHILRFLNGALRSGPLAFQSMTSLIYSNCIQNLNQV
jgi:hypothetical protein